MTMSSQTVIRPARDDELSAVLRLWQEADVTPPSVTDSIEGLTRLTNAPGGILLVATTDDQYLIRYLQAVLPGMHKQGDGHIINVSTVGGRITGLSQGPYCASKFALEALSEILAGEVKTFGVRVAIVEPGVTLTPLLDKRRTIPKNSFYPQERRMNASYDAEAMQQTPGLCSVAHRQCP